MTNFNSMDGAKTILTPEACLTNHGITKYHLLYNGINPQDVYNAMIEYASQFRHTTKQGRLVTDEKEKSGTGKVIDQSTGHAVRDLYVPQKLRTIVPNVQTSSGTRLDIKKKKQSNNMKYLICLLFHRKYRVLTGLHWQGHDHTCTKCGFTFYD